MKYILTLAFIFTFLTSNASIIDAQETFEAKDFQASFQEYEKLAQLGNVRAQYNTAIMAFKGQGTKKDVITAFAWASTAAKKDHQVNQLLKIIEKQLDSQDLQIAKNKAIDFNQKFGYDAAQISLGPLDKETKNTENQTNDSGFEEYKIVRNKKSKNKIDYPQKSLKKSGRGWVELSYNIYPNGTVQDINIMEQYPHELFAPSAIDYISKQKYDFYKDGEKIIPKHEVYSSFRVKYGMYGISNLNSKTKQHINQLLKKALSGNLSAQYQYTNLFFTVLNGGGGVSGKTINKWLLRSAQFGIPKAQFRLGRNIYYGFFCQVDKQKGFDWVIRAAENNIANAQYLTYSILNTGKLINSSQKSAQYWLKKAAQNNSNNGQIRYAKFIAQQKDPDQKDISLALDLLSEYADTVAKTTDWYQVQALLLSLSHNYRAAQIAISSAIKMAKKSHWDLSELKKQKEMILKLSKNNA